MWLDELGIGFVDLDAGQIDPEWGFITIEYSGVVKTLYLNGVVLDFPVKCCHRRYDRPVRLFDGTSIATDLESHYCVLPPGHESGDLPCIGAIQPPGKFLRIVRVTDRHPHENQTTTD